MRKIKIAHINPSLETGGIESVIVMLCNHLDKNRFDVAFCSLSSEMSKVKELDSKVERVSLGFNPQCLNGIRLISHFMSAVKELGCWIKKWEPDIIHIHGFFTMYLLVAIAVKIYRPHAIVVKTIHTSGMFYSSTRLIDRFRLLIEKLATKLNRTYIVGISGQVYRQACKNFSKEAVGIDKIYNGVELKRFYHSDDNELKRIYLGDKELLVGYASRIVEGKNHLFLLDIWKALKNDGLTNARLLFIGGGDLLDKVKATITKKNLQDDVVCIGYSSEVPTLLSICDLAVFPSDYEGFGIALIEMLASSLPVIASDIPPFKEVITSGENGFTIPLNDSGQWLSTLRAILSDSSLRNTVGMKALSRSKDFSVENMVYGYEKLYYDAFCQ